MCVHQARSGVHINVQVELNEALERCAFQEHAVDCV